MAGEYRIIEEALRRHPTEAVVADIRLRYPTEREVDAVYTAKMMRRNGPPYHAVALERLVSGTQALIAHETGQDVAVEDAAWLSGGASKLQMVFHLRWRGPGGAGPETRTKLVLRMEPAASITESSRRREYEVLKAVEGVVPAPHAYWVDADATFLPYPAIVYSFVTGVAKPSSDPGKVTGLGQNFGPALRARIAPHFTGLLGALHRIDAATHPALKSFDAPEVGSNASIIRQINATRRAWEEDRIEEEPVMEIVYQWLIANAPPLDHVSIVHGDYRSGNFLFDEDAGEITAWLDWEGAVLGDRHRDLTYAMLPVFQHIAEDGVTPLGSGMMEPDAFYAAYEVSSGLSVDPARIIYYNVFNRYVVTMLTLSAAPRSAAVSGTHQDVLVYYVSAVGYPALAELARYFREIAA